MIRHAAVTAQPPFLLSLVLDESMVMFREDAVQSEVQKLARGSWSSFKVKWGGNAKSQRWFKIKEDE